MLAGAITISFTKYNVFLYLPGIPQIFYIPFFFYKILQITKQNLEAITSHLTHCGLMVPIHRYWSALVQVMACCTTSPSHHFNHWWLIVNCTFRNKLQWNLSKKKMHLKKSSAKLQPFCSGLDKLTWQKSFSARGRLMCAIKTHLLVLWRAYLSCTTADSGLCLWSAEGTERKHSTSEMWQ